MTTFDELTQRLADLESKQLGVDDLPMAQLQRWLQQRWLDDANAAANPPAPFVTTLGAGSDGDETYYSPVPGSGIVWHLRYREGATTRKWEFVGGASLRAEALAAASTASAAYVALAGDPAITVPLAGDYEILWGSMGSNNAVSALCLHSLSLGGTPASDGLSVRAAGTTANAQSSGVSMRSAALAAGDVVRAQYRVTSGTGTWEQRWLSIRPIRVG